PRRRLMMGIRRILLAVAVSVLVAAPNTIRADDLPAAKAPAKKVSMLAALFGGGFDDGATNTPPAETSFKQVKAIGVSCSTGQIVAIARGPEDTVIAVAGPARGVGRSSKSKGGAAEVQLYSGEGKLLRKWNVEFAATAAATAPNGEIVIAGDGKIAKFDVQGKELACVDAPHVASLLKNADAIKKQAEERKKSMIQLYEQQVTQLKKQQELQAKQEKDAGGDANPSSRIRPQFDQ